jgi:histidinol-phosphate aminotransferase
MSQDWVKLLIRPNIREMKPFPSGALARTWLNSTAGSWFLLESNENPHNLFGFNRYPEPQPTELINLLSDLYSVESNQLLITRGSAEGLELIIRLFCEPREDVLLTLWPSFELIEHFANIHGVFIEKRILEKRNDFDFSLAEANGLETGKFKMIYINSPNNPTGNVLSNEVILSTCRRFYKKAIVVVDEAYIEYSNQGSIASYIREYENLIVLRTLSKAYGLAGVRCGVILAVPEIIEYLKIMIHPAPVPEPTIDIVRSALSRECLHKVQESIRDTIEQREFLRDAFQSLAFVKKVFQSECNFILIEVVQAEALIEFCKERNILLRDKSSQSQLKGCIRITIGNKEENRRLVEVFGEYESLYKTREGEE